MDEIETRQVGKPGGCPCPKCGYIDTRVVDSRPAVDALKRGSVKRRRQCYRCETRYTTMEIAFPLPVTGNYMKRLSDLQDNIEDVLRDIKALKAFHAATDGLS